MEIEQSSISPSTQTEMDHIRGSGGVDSIVRKSWVSYPEWRVHWKGDKLMPMATTEPAGLPSCLYQPWCSEARGASTPRLQHQH